MEKIFIQNRHGLKIAIQIESPAHPVGLAFVMPGLAGFKEKTTTATQARTFVDGGYTTVSFDPTNSLGESGGDFSDATTTNYYEDLEDVIAWASGQDWYQTPFVLCGHSLGGLCVALYAEKYPERIKALAPLATSISGDFYLKSHDEAELAEWRRRGFKEYVSNAKPGVVESFKWSFVEDLLNYDILRQVEKLTMPVLMIVGELDKSEKVSSQQYFFDRLPSQEKELHIIPGAPHTWREEKHLKASYDIISAWLKKLK